MPILQMRWPLKRLRTQTLVTPVMFLQSLVLLALLATSGVQSGLPRYARPKWALTDEPLESEDAEEQSLAAEEDYWPDVELEMVKLVSMEDQNFQTTSESYAIKEQDHEESSVWKIALVAVVLLVSVLGCLSLAYYLCVWRGGRVHYRLQKTNHAFI